MVKYNSKRSERKKTIVLTPFHSLTPLEISLTPKRALLRIELHANRVTKDNILMSILKQARILIT